MFKLPTRQGFIFFLSFSTFFVSMTIKCFSLHYSLCNHLWVFTELPTKPIIRIAC